MLYDIPIRERTFEDLFPDVGSFPLCVDIEKGTEVWVAAGMLVEYLESFTDAIVVRENYKPIGLVGGYDMLNNLKENPTNDFFHRNKVEDIMMKDIPIVTMKTPLGSMIKDWKESGRAFAVIPNALNDFSCISAKFLIKVGMLCKTDFFVSQIPKKNLVTFKISDTIGDIIASMFENKTRRLVLDNTDQFISDRIILGYISHKLNFLKDFDKLMEMPVNLLELEQVRTISEDVSFDQLCGIMSKMQYPYVIYRDKVFSPWDICETLMSDEITDYEIPKNKLND